MWGYWRAHNLEPGTNLIAHHFKLIGLPDWIPEEQEVVRSSPLLQYICLPMIACCLTVVPFLYKHLLPMQAVFTSLFKHREALLTAHSLQKRAIEIAF